MADIQNKTAILSLKWPCEVEEGGGRYMDKGRNR